MCMDSVTMDMRVFKLINATPLTYLWKPTNHVFHSFFTGSSVVNWAKWGKMKLPIWLTWVWDQHGARNEPGCQAKDLNLCARPWGWAVNVCLCTASWKTHKHLRTEQGENWGHSRLTNDWASFKVLILTELKTIPALRFSWISQLSRNRMAFTLAMAVNSFAGCYQHTH